MIPEHTNFCTICHPVQWASAIVRPKSYCFQVTFWQLGSGQRYQILSHVFARCASQKTHWHARIAHFSRKSVQFSHVRVVSRAILACQCVFWLAQRKSVTQIIYLRPLPTGNTHILHILVQKCRLACLAAGGAQKDSQGSAGAGVYSKMCVFWLAQRKSVTQIIYLRPLPTGNTHILHILVQKCRLACLAAGGAQKDSQGSAGAGVYSKMLWADCSLLRLRSLVSSQALNLSCKWYPSDSLCSVLALLAAHVNDHIFFIN